ncbi:MAG TPA: hypothetical protein VF611_18800 [Pyrinomonadaceae bacterium]|jgi:hypothetical protein
MPNHRRGYIGQNEKSQGFARVTITDGHGKRRKVVRRAKDKSEARAILKALTRQLDDEGSKAVDYCPPEDAPDAAEVRAVQVGTYGLVLNFIAVAQGKGSGV